mmetsp:Transcript_870/g.2736  ORF Transcript_870/g.2736 Transcript_870/m.2736 type:complete len:624 (+) Transcript_870:1395-3266(+)
MAFREPWRSHMVSMFQAQLASSANVASAYSRATASPGSLSFAATIKASRSPFVSLHMGSWFRGSSARCQRACRALSRAQRYAGCVSQAPSTKALRAPSTSSHMGRLFAGALASFCSAPNAYVRTVISLRSLSIAACIRISRVSTCSHIGTLLSSCLASSSNAQRAYDLVFRESGSESFAASTRTRRAAASFHIGFLFTGSTASLSNDAIAYNWALWSRRWVSWPAATSTFRARASPQMRLRFASAEARPQTAAKALSRARTSAAWVSAAASRKLAREPCLSSHIGSLLASTCTSLSSEERAQAREVRWLGSDILEILINPPRTCSSCHIGTLFSSATASCNRALRAKARTFGSLDRMPRSKALRAPWASQMGPRFEGASVSSCNAANANTRGLKCDWRSSWARSTIASRAPVVSCHIDSRLSDFVARFQSAATAFSSISTSLLCAASIKTDCFVRTCTSSSCHIGRWFEAAAARFHMAASPAARVWRSKGFCSLDACSMAARAPCLSPHIVGLFAGSSAMFRSACTEHRRLLRSSGVAMRAPWIKALLTPVWLSHMRRWFLRLLASLWMAHSACIRLSRCRGLPFSAASTSKFRTPSLFSDLHIDCRLSGWSARWLSTARASA